MEYIVSASFDYLQMHNMSRNAIVLKRKTGSRLAHINGQRNGELLSVSAAGDFKDASIVRISIEEYILFRYSWSNMFQCKHYFVKYTAISCTFCKFEWMTM